MQFHNDGNSKNVLFESDSDKADVPNLEVEGDLFYERDSVSSEDEGISIDGDNNWVYYYLS